VACAQRPVVVLSMPPICSHEATLIDETAVPAVPCVSAVPFPLLPPMRAATNSPPVDAEACTKLTSGATDVDNAATLIFVVDRPVDNELTAVEVDVDSAVTLLFVVDRPVDSEPTAVEVDVDSDVNWPTFTASVGFTPAATLVRVTGVVEPTPPKVICV
jgi:hypothetical protein